MSTDSPSSSPSDANHGLRFVPLGLSPQGSEVLAEVIGEPSGRGNPWLSSSPLVALAEAFSELAKVQQVIQRREVALEAESREMAWSLAQGVAQDLTENFSLHAEREVVQAIGSAVTSAASLARHAFGASLHGAFREKQGDKPNMNAYQMASDVQMAQANLAAICGQLPSQSTLEVGRLDAERKLLNAALEIAHERVESAAQDRQAALDSVDQVVAQLSKMSNEQVQQIQAMTHA
jgi:hypothetical protein